MYHALCVSMYDSKMHASYFLRAGILQQRCQSQRVHPLIHALAAVSGEMISPHVRMLCFEGELFVNFVLGLADGNFVRR
jgi:hypothetical protein